MYIIFHKIGKTISYTLYTTVHCTWFSASPFYSTQLDKVVDVSKGKPVNLLVSLSSRKLLSYIAGS